MKRELASWGEGEMLQVGLAFVRPHGVFGSLRLASLFEKCPLEKDDAAQLPEC